MKKILTVNRISFALVGLVTGWFVTFAEPYRYSENIGVWGFILLLVPGFLLGLAMLYYIATFSASRRPLQYLKSFFIIVVAFPVAVSIVVYGAKILWFFPWPLFFISGAVGAILIGYALSAYGDFTKRNYIWLAVLGGITGAILLSFAVPSWGDSSPDGIVWLYPVWLTVIGFYIGRSLESKFFETSENASIYGKGRKVIALTIVLLLVLLSLYKVFPTFTPDKAEFKTIATLSSVSQVNLCRNYQILDDRWQVLSFLTDPYRFSDLAERTPDAVKEGLVDEGRVEMVDGREVVSYGSQRCEIKTVYDSEGNFVRNDKTCVDDFQGLNTGLSIDRCVTEVMKIKGLNSEEGWFRLRYSDFFI